MIKVQDIVLEYKQHGATQAWIYRNVIAPMYDISYSTFNRYLAYPAKQEIKHGKKKSNKPADQNQLPLFP
jgi:hypothetical protein